MQRNGLPSAAVVSTRVVRDSFGTDSHVLATLEDRTQVSIAIGSSVRVYTDRTPPPGLKDLMTMTVPDEGPEAALLAAAEAHPLDERLVRIGLSLVPGVNGRAGAHLAGLAEAADRLVVVHDDAAAARPLLAFLCARGHDGNEGRWRAVRHGLALASWVAVRDGDASTSARYGEALVAGEEAALADLRGPAARIRVHENTHPIPPDRDIQRARELGQFAEETRLRWVRLDLWLTQLATGWAGWHEGELLAAIEADVAALRELEAPPTE